MAEVTNYIDRLVAELCPDGVDFYTIDELITLDFGTRITKSKDAGTIYPVYGGGGASFRTDNYNREDKYVVSLCQRNAFDMFLVNSGCLTLVLRIR